MNSYIVTRIYESPSGIYCEFARQSEEGTDEKGMTLLFTVSDFYDTRLCEGKVISDDRFEELYEVSCVAEAAAKAQRFLSSGDHSKKQLMLKLMRSDIKGDHAEKATLLMEEQGYINEGRQAEHLAQTYCKRKYWGKNRIMQELLQKGYGRDAVRDAVSRISPEEYMEALNTVIERKYPDPPEDKREKDKRIAALIRLGYSVSEITLAFQKYREA